MLIMGVASCQTQTLPVVPWLSTASFNWFFSPETDPHRGPRKVISVRVPRGCLKYFKHGKTWQTGLLRGCRTDAWLMSFRPGSAGFPICGAHGRHTANPSPRRPSAEENTSRWLANYRITGATSTAPDTTGFRAPDGPCAAFPRPEAHHGADLNRSVRELRLLIRCSH